MPAKSNPRPRHHLSGTGESTRRQSTAPAITRTPYRQTRPICWNWEKIEIESTRPGCGPIHIWVAMESTMYAPNAAKTTQIKTMPFLSRMGRLKRNYTTDAPCLNAIPFSQIHRPLLCCAGFGPVEASLTQFTNGRSAAIISQCEHSAGIQPVGIPVIVIGNLNGNNARRTKTSTGTNKIQNKVCRMVTLRSRNGTTPITPASISTQKSPRSSHTSLELRIGPCSDKATKIKYSKIGNDHASAKCRQLPLPALPSSDKPADNSTCLAP